jgi:NAD(P)-dependent dehydrogenase (short-subunit alcohol dehydrogenase family)
MGITKIVSSPLPSHPSLTITLPLSLIRRQAALEARTHDIRVNVISPGFLLTNLLAPIVGREGGVPTKAWDALEARQGRSAKFEEIGGCDCFDY